MESIYKKISEIQQKGVSAAVCTIIESKGSTPRKSGSKMLVYNSGEIFGTIGGGSLEQLVKKQAIKLIAENNNGIFEYNLEKDAGMSCGGFNKVFIEPIKVKNKLFLFGAGHIGTFLANMASNLNFAVTLIDNRKDIYQAEDNHNVRFLNSSFNEALEVLDFDESTYVCVATYTHDLDKMIIGICAQKSLAYLGMIGSKNKIAAIKKYLLNKNILTEKEFDKVDSPMGIGIVCQTPEEIAVSILAKLIDVRGGN